MDHAPRCRRRTLLIANEQASQDKKSRTKQYRCPTNDTPNGHEQEPHSGVAQDLPAHPGQSPSRAPPPNYAVNATQRARGLTTEPLQTPRKPLPPDRKRQRANRQPFPGSVPPVRRGQNYNPLNISVYCEQSNNKFIYLCYCFTNLI